MDFHRFPVDEQYCEVKFESFGFSNRQVSAEIFNMKFDGFDIIFSYIQIQMKWMGADQNNVNSNISLAQFSFNVQLIDSYSTDYYEIAYPGLIMRVYSLQNVIKIHGQSSCIPLLQVELLVLL